MYNMILYKNKNVKKKKKFRTKINSSSRLEN